MCIRDSVFRDEFGRGLPLSTYFNGHKPVLLALVYYTCPMLCNLVLTGMESSLRAISLDPGRDFEVVAVSFDPHDTPAIAAVSYTHLDVYKRQAQIEPRDRWAIVAYVRVLQLSQNASLNDVPPGERAALAKGVSK